MLETLATLVYLLLVHPIQTIPHAYHVPLRVLHVLSIQHWGA